MDASNRRHIREAEKAAKIEAINDTAVLAELLQLPHGRSWLWRQLEAGAIFRTTFTPNALMSAFNEGQRNAALKLLNDILSVDPEGFIIMVKEHGRRTDAADAARRVADQVGNDDNDNDDAVGNDENLVEYDPSAELAEREG